MFDSKEGLDVAVRMLIKSLANGFSTYEQFRESIDLNEEDFKQALQKAISDDYVTGFTLHQAIGGINGISFFSPKPTNKGYQFISES